MSAVAQKQMTNAKDTPVAESSCAVISRVETTQAGQGRSMATYVALLRAVNVGGTGRLPMTELKAMCEAAGFLNARTYIASGNAIFESDATEAGVKRALEHLLATYARKHVGVIVRTASEMARVVKANPFSDKPPSRTVAIFLDNKPTPSYLTAARGLRQEELHLGAREIYVHYGDAIATSKLVIPAAEQGTARNMNTIAKLAELAASR